MIWILWSVAVPHIVPHWQSSWLKQLLGGRTCDAAMCTVDAPWYSPQLRVPGGHVSHDATQHNHLRSVELMPCFFLQIFSPSLIFLLQLSAPTLFDLMGLSSPLFQGWFGACYWRNTVPSRGCSVVHTELHVVCDAISVLPWGAQRSPQTVELKQSLRPSLVYPQARDEPGCDLSPSESLEW